MSRPDRVRHSLAEMAEILRSFEKGTQKALERPVTRTFVRQRWQRGEASTRSSREQGWADRRHAQLEPTKATPPVIAQELAALMPNGRFELITECAHVPPLQAPEKFSAMIQEFTAEKVAA